MSPHQNLEAKYEQYSVIEMLEKIGSRWRMTVIHVLREGDLRFNELKHMTGANSQTLSHMLDDLQELGYVEREVKDGGSIVVYYSFTQKGEELLPAFDDISEWGERRMSEDGDVESQTGSAGSQLRNKSMEFSFD